MKYPCPACMDTGQGPTCKNCGGTGYDLGGNVNGIDEAKVRAARDYAYDLTCLILGRQALNKEVETPIQEQAERLHMDAMKWWPLEDADLIREAVQQGVTDAYREMGSRVKVDA